jgi:hypothetical protein
MELVLTVPGNADGKTRLEQIRCKSAATGKADDTPSTNSDPKSK